MNDCGFLFLKKLAILNFMFVFVTYKFRGVQTKEVMIEVIVIVKIENIFGYIVLKTFFMKKVSTVKLKINLQKF